jgi:hypothetical protein
MEIQPKDTSKGHFYVSLVKSFLRMAAAAAFIMAGYNPELISAWIKVGGGLLGLAECLGVLEELV